MGINAIWGPPQSGKTTLAIDLAFALSMQDKSVCLISAELYSELSMRLNTRIEKEKSLVAAYHPKESLQQIVHTADELLYVLAVPFDNDAFEENISEDAARSLLEQAYAMFDHVIVDCPSHTGSVLAAWALSMADAVLLLTGGRSSSVLWQRAYKRAVDSVQSKTLHICNEVTESFDYRSLNTLLEVTPDVWIPYCPDADTIQAIRRTLYMSGGRYGRAYSKSIDDICELLSREEERENV